MISCNNKFCHYLCAFLKKYRDARSTCQGDTHGALEKNRAQLLKLASSFTRGPENNIQKQLLRGVANVTPITTARKTYTTFITNTWWIIDN